MSLRLDASILRPSTQRFSAKETTDHAPWPLSLRAHLLDPRVHRLNQFCGLQAAELAGCAAGDSCAACNSISSPMCGSVSVTMPTSASSAMTGRPLISVIDHQHHHLFLIDANAPVATLPTRQSGSFLATTCQCAADGGNGLRLVAGPPRFLTFGGRHGVVQAQARCRTLSCRSGDMPVEFRSTGRVRELASSLTRNQVPGNRLRVRVPCPPLAKEKAPLGVAGLFDWASMDVRFGCQPRV